MEQVDEFCEMVRTTMMVEYEKLDKELHKMRQDPDWETTVRPRRLVKWEWQTLLADDRDKMKTHWQYAKRIECSDHQQNNAIKNYQIWK